MRDEKLWEATGGRQDAYNAVLAVRAKYGDARWWESDDPRVKALGQLQEPIIVMAFDEFHHAVEQAIGRPVWTHEFADPQRLIEEIEGERPPATMRDILDVIPKDTRVVVVSTE